MDELTGTEHNDLERLEVVIDHGLRTFMEVGNALLEIRDRKLYRVGFKNFKAYCDERWNLSRPRAYELMNAAKVAGVLSATADILPTGERQLRPLSKLTPEKQVEAWDLAVDMAGGAPSYRDVILATKRVTSPPPVVLPEPTPREDWPDQECPGPDYIKNVHPDGYLTWERRGYRRRYDRLSLYKRAAKTLKRSTVEVMAFKTGYSLQTCDELVSLWEWEADWQHYYGAWMLQHTIKKGSRPGWHVWGFEA